MKRVVLSVLFALMMSAGFTLNAYAEELLVGGEAVGVKIDCDGVWVAELCPVETMDGRQNPAADAGIKPGDIILEIDGKAVSDAASVISAMDESQGTVKLSLLRDGRELEVEVDAAQSNEGRRMLGLWLRDSMSGVGTLTFSDPETGLYGALGHPVSDSESGLLIPVDEGEITEVFIVGIKPGTVGIPGELKGSADMTKVLGTVEKNTQLGIFGHLYEKPEGELIQTGQMVPGPAVIYSTLEGREKGEYSVEINRVYRQDGESHAMLTVTDPELISRTGGIVQGMSGSPIIQDGKLVGAVTHVLVSDPTRGYGIFIENMLNAAG